MITPKWVSILAQPLAIEDLIAYLMAAITAPLSESQIFELGAAGDSEPGSTCSWEAWA